jgi:hypothetical protein
MKIVIFKHFFANSINTKNNNSNGSMGFIYVHTTGPDCRIITFWIFWPIRPSGLTKTPRLTSTISLPNVYNRKHILYFERITYKRINLLHVMPSPGISFNFC